MPFDRSGNLGEDKMTFESNLQSSGLWMQSVPKPIKKIEVQLRTIKHVKSGGLVIIARKLFVHYRKKSFVSVLWLKPLGWISEQPLINFDRRNDDTVINMIDHHLMFSNHWSPFIFIFTSSDCSQPHRQRQNTNHQHFHQSWQYFHQSMTTFSPIVTNIFTNQWQYFHQPMTITI